MEAEEPQPHREEAEAAGERRKCLLAFMTCSPEKEEAEDANEISIKTLLEALRLLFLPSFLICSASLPPRR